MAISTTTPRPETEKRRQLAELESAIVGGTPVAEAVADHCTRHGLNAKLGGADLSQLRRRWARRARAERDQADANFGLAVARFERIFCRATATGDDATALEAERSLCELFGLYPGTVNRSEG